MNLACPDQLREAIEQRCFAARDGRLQPYSALLRAAVLQLLSTMFPRFAARRGPEVLIRDANDFVRNFGARQAQFFHLSTEYVRFAQQHLDDPVARALLEYEWTLFAVEVVEEHVGAVTPPGRALLGVYLNPTARLVALPFELDNSVAAAEQALRDDLPPFVYAIYRTAVHQVCTLPLSELDVTMLRELADGAPRVSADERSGWIAQSLQLGLVIARHF